MKWQVHSHYGAQKLKEAACLFSGKSLCNGGNYVWMNEFALKEIQTVTSFQIIVADWKYIIDLLSPHVVLFICIFYSLSLSLMGTLYSCLPCWLPVAIWLSNDDAIPTACLVESYYPAVIPKFANTNKYYRKKHNIHYLMENSLQFSTRLQIPRMTFERLLFKADANLL